MPSLVETLTDSHRKTAVVEDCCSLIDEEVESKSGLTGLAIKAGYKAFKGIRPGLVREAVEELLTEFASALDPFFGEAQQRGCRAEDHFSKNTERVADALLSITDRRADRVKTGLVKATYGKLRPMAKKNVAAAVPRVGRLVDKYTS